MRPNEIIKNTELTKKYYLEHDVPVKCESSVIEWVSKNLTLKEVKKKQKNKKTGQQRLITKLVKNKSFFSFFTTIDVSNLSSNPAELT
jgi:nucleosome assembly protein 1-like 1